MTVAGEQAGPDQTRRGRDSTLRNRPLVAVALIRLFASAALVTPSASLPCPRGCSNVAAAALVILDGSALCRDRSISVSMIFQHVNDFCRRATHARVVLYVSWSRPCHFGAKPPPNGGALAVDRVVLREPGRAGEAYPADPRRAPGATRPRARPCERASPCCARASPSGAARWPRGRAASVAAGAGPSTRARRAS